MANAGKYIEEIAIALGKEVPSVRGKALSLTRNGLINEIPKQKESHAKDVVDAIAALGDAIKDMTVAAIAVVFVRFLPVVVLRQLTMTVLLSKLRPRPSKKQQPNN